MGVLKCSCAECYEKENYRNSLTKEMSGRMKSKGEGNDKPERKTKLQQKFLKTHCTNQIFM